MKNITKIIAITLFTCACKKNKTNKDKTNKATQEATKSDNQTRDQEAILQSLQSNTQSLYNDVNNLQISDVLEKPFAQNNNNGTKNGNTTDTKNQENQLNNFTDSVDLARFEQGFKYGLHTISGQSNKPKPKYQSFKEYIEAFKKAFEAIQKDVEAYKEHQDLTKNQHYIDIKKQINILSKLLKGTATVQEIQEIIIGNYPKIESLHSNTVEFKENTKTIK